MKKKFVVAVAAVVMAAVMSVSAFAANDVKVPSITGDATGPASEIFVPQSSAEASATANAAYNTLASTEGSVADKLTALAGGKATADAAAAAGVKSANDLSVRAIGDVKVEGEVSVSVIGIVNVAVIMYLDSNGNWVVTTARVVNGRVIISVPYPPPVVILSVYNGLLSSIPGRRGRLSPARNGSEGWERPNRMKRPTVSCSLHGPGAFLRLRKEEGAFLGG